MSGISNVSAYAYSPYSVTYTGNKYGEYRGPEDFKPGLYDPVQREKAEKRKKNLVTAGLIFVGAGAIWFFTKGKGKGLINELRNFFTSGGKAGSKAAADVAPDVKNVIKKTKKVVKPKAKAVVIAENADLAPNTKVKPKGKNYNRKIRHNKKQIIAQTKLNEEMEAFTQKDLDALHNSMRTPATAEELAYMQKNYKAATNSLADVMESQGIVRTKNKSGRVILEQKPKAPTPTAVPLNPVADNAKKIADLQAQIAKQDEIIAQWSKPGMEKWAQHAQAAKAKLVAKLENLQKASNVAA